MTTQEIANQLVDACRRGEFEKVYRELYSPEIRSIEQEGFPVPPVKGMDALIKKGEQWNESIKEMHGGEVGDPIVAGNHFACTMSYDVTFKDERGRTKMDEICIYEVQDGKIVKEQFFYELGEM